MLSFPGGSLMQDDSPAARGIVAVATEVVCTITFSSTVKPFMQSKQCSTLKTPNPKMADCRLPMVTQPVWSPKYVFEKQRMLPTHSPVVTARTVSWRLGAVAPNCLHPQPLRYSQRLAIILYSVKTGLLCGKCSYSMQKSETTYQSGLSCCPSASGLLLASYWLSSLRWLSNSISESTLKGVTNTLLRAVSEEPLATSAPPSSELMMSLFRFL